MRLIITFALTFEVESKKKTPRAFGFGFDSVEGTRVGEKKKANGSGYLRKRESMPGQ